MRLFKQLKINKIIQFFKKLFRTLGENAFLVFIGLLFLALILGGLIFYQYSILAEKTELQILEGQLQFKENLYQEILKIWESRQKKFEEVELKTYPDPFRGPTSPATTTSEESPPVS